MVGPPGMRPGTAPATAAPEGLGGRRRPSGAQGEPAAVAELFVAVARRGRRHAVGARAAGRHGLAAGGGAGAERHVLDPQHGLEPGDAWVDRKPPAGAPRHEATPAGDTLHAPRRGALSVIPGSWEAPPLRTSPSEPPLRPSGRPSRRSAGASG